MEIDSQDTNMATYGHPYDYNIGYKVTFMDHKTNERREEVEHLETREEYDEPRFEIKWYVNGELTYSVSSVRAKRVYDLAVPSEALVPNEGNRWHVLMFQPAMEELKNLPVNETLTLCYQDAGQTSGHDIERIVVNRILSPDLQYD